MKFPYFFGTFAVCYILIKHNLSGQSLPRHIITLNIFSLKGMGGGEMFC